jgi:hypothetical protein
MLKLSDTGETVKVYKKVSIETEVVASRAHIEDRITEAQVELADAQADLIMWDQLHPAAPSQVPVAQTNEVQ